MSTYSFIPTAVESLDNLDDEMWSENIDETTINIEAFVIACCREQGYSGAHVLTGGHGPVYGTDGYEENYCGWIDARVGAERIAS